MFRRKTDAPMGDNKKAIEAADAVLREHRDTVARVNNILAEEVKRIDKYLSTKKAGA